MLWDEAEVVFERIRAATTKPAETLPLEEKYEVLRENFSIWVRAFNRVYDERQETEEPGPLWKAELEGMLQDALDAARADLKVVEQTLINRHGSLAFTLFQHVEYRGDSSDLEEEGRFLCFHRISSTLTPGEAGQLRKKQYVLNTEEVWLTTGKTFSWTFSHNGRPADHRPCKALNDGEVQRLQKLITKKQIKGDDEALTYLEQVRSRYATWYAVFGYATPERDTTVLLPTADARATEKELKQHITRFETKRTALWTYVYLTQRPAARTHELNDWMSQLTGVANSLKQVKLYANYRGMGRGRGDLGQLALLLQALLPTIEQEFEAVIPGMVDREKKRIMNLLVKEEHLKELEKT